MSLVFLSALAATSTALAVENPTTLMARAEIAAVQGSTTVAGTEKYSVDNAELDFADDDNFDLDLTDVDNYNNGTEQMTKRDTEAQQVDNLLFSLSMAQFQSHRNAKNPSGLIWTSDGCTDSPDYPFGYNFHDSCQRHDFGYRNYRKERRCASANRKKIDGNLKNDLYRECNKKSGFAKIHCTAIANEYYIFVRGFGGLKWC